MWTNTFVSDETRAKWRKMTVDAILTTPEYKSGQQATIENIASTLSKLLAPLASPTSKDTARIRSLIPLLAEAAEILIQCRKEPSEFCWQRPTPRTPCQASYMEDAEGIFDDEELEKSGALVELLVFPLVLRRAEDGELVVISKAQVLTFPVKVAAAIEPTSGGSNSMDLDMGAGV